MRTPIAVPKYHINLYILTSEMRTSPYNRNFLFCPRSVLIRGSTVYVGRGRRKEGTACECSVGSLYKWGGGGGNIFRNERRADEGRDVGKEWEGEGGNR